MVDLAVGAIFVESVGGGLGHGVDVGGSSGSW